MFLCTLQYSTISTESLFQAQDVQNKCKSSGGIADIYLFTPIAVPGCQLLYHTAILLKVLYHKMKNVFFIFVLFVYVCQKYCKPITIQYYRVDSVSWIPRLILLD